MKQDCDSYPQAEKKHLRPEFGRLAKITAKNAGALRQ